MDDLLPSMSAFRRFSVRSNKVLTTETAQGNMSVGERAAVSRAPIRMTRGCPFDGGRAWNEAQGNCAQGERRRLLG